jgi:hypothetical protein
MKNLTFQEGINEDILCNKDKQNWIYNFELDVQVSWDIFIKWDNSFIDKLFQVVEIAYNLISKVK